jgi:GH15 family glucan-1,4-alpha-glucosidase
MYKEIGSYGIVGDLRTVALIGLDGSVDWLCYPDLDSPSVFGALLDERKGGRFLIQPLEEFDAAARYLDRTNVLCTRFRTRSGILRVTDFMQIPRLFRDLEDGNDDEPRALYRCLDLEQGEMRIRVLFQPRFDYARIEPRLEPLEGGVYAAGGGWSIALTATRQLELQEGGAAAVWHLQRGERVWLRLGSTRSGRCSSRDMRCEPPSRSEQALQRTVSFWRDWLERSETGRTLSFGPYREMVERSALALKLLSYAPTGTIAAAATTSLPESVGGVRNWDYRYTWIRDTSFTLKALYNLGHLSETEAYLHWIESLLPERGQKRLQIMYGLRGERSLPERTLDHLDGYKGSRPVRIGNEAAEQLQLDIYGELMDAALGLSNYVGKIDAELWPFLRDICDFACANWRERDYGIWEVRDGPRHFVYSKVMCWVALDRGLTIAERYGFPAPDERWRETMRAIKSEVLQLGFDSRQQSFVQHYETNALDASSLLIPLLGFLPPNDPKVVSTVEAIQRELGGERGFLHRYRAEDGLSGGEGTFLLCTFWLVDCLILMDRVEEAQQLLLRTEHAANHLGLFAEEFDPEWQEPLGNFPQAFTHIGYVNSVINLLQAGAQKHKAGEEPPWSLPRLLRKKLPFGEITLNDGTPQEQADPRELDGQLKTAMNLLRGAFFDSARGRVAYEDMKRSELYSRYLDLSYNLRSFDPAVLDTRERSTAFWINLYNVLVIHGVIELDIRDSVQEVRNFFRRIRYDVGGHLFTPDDVEHGILRADKRPPYGLTRMFSRSDPRFRFSLSRVDPRIHFALVCASSSCPPIEVYTAGELDRELDVSGQTFLNSGGVIVDRERREISLSRIFLWYADDFPAGRQELLSFVASYLYDRETRRFLETEGRSCTLLYQKYDWRLNRSG